MKAPFFLALALLLLASTAAEIPPVTASTDPYIWLESITGERALAWVKQENEVSTRELARSPAFATMNARFLDILNSDARIPFVARYGDRYYNFWRDAKHERGLWRRTTLAEYRKADPTWETVLDLDALAAAEHENWVWQGADVLPPDYSRCLLRLSRGGGDASIVREFDLGSGSFVADGFALPESKSDVGWIDRDHLFLGAAIDSSTMTTSGYARVVKRWTRGEPASAATLVYEGKDSDVGVGAYHDQMPGFERDFVVRTMSFYSNEMFLLRDRTLIRLDKPDDADALAWREWLLLQLRMDWTAGGRTYPAGALIATKLDDFLAGGRTFELLFEPTDRKSLVGYSATRHALLIKELDNVRSRIYLARPDGGSWSRTPLEGLPEFGTIDASAVDSRTSDDYWLTATDFLIPTTLSLGHVDGSAPERLKQAPSFFDGSGSEVSQHEAVSKDGTHVPYFAVTPKDLVLDGHAPTLLTGYGGFESSALPRYNGVNGAGWIERGGVYVVANIRGGGEFGPRWHRAALKANRPRAYEDFITVAEDLIQRRVTDPAHLGCIGGSNGGLLVGNMLTMHPDLFGAIVCKSPLLDMQRYHKLLAGASWISEYGDPDDPKDWAFIRVFSPYANVKSNVHYPRTLFTTSTRDDRVHPAHARKMAAKMKAQGHDVLYYENVEGGHGGSANNKQEAFMSALAYQFLWKQLEAATLGTVPTSDGHSARDR